MVITGKRWFKNIQVKPKIVIITGCRPDIIKMWPVYQALSENSRLETVVIQSGQHDELAETAFNDFSYKPDTILSVPSEDKAEIGWLHSRLVRELTTILKELKPDMVLVHGDTTTAFAGTVSAFLRNIPVSHIEAGLRTARFEYPFPEEGYRRAISRLTTLHFAPTKLSAINLVSENIDPQKVYVTGNTVVDSLRYIINSTVSLGEIRTYKQILVTAHRRETYGTPLKEFCKSLINVVTNHKNVKVVWPVHENPQINKPVSYYLDGRNKISLRKPANYRTFIQLLNSADIVITDSGGVMEEAGVLNKPIIVLRTETERPEILSLDYIKLIGYNFKKLEEIIDYWLINPPINSKQLNTLFGDGTAGNKIAEIIDIYFKDKK